MKYSCSIWMSPLHELLEIAKTAEEVGFDSIALPDSLFYMEQQSVDYPYTPDGSRMWNPETPIVDPLIAAGAMGAVTTKLRFYTNVMKLGSRQPLLLARQVGSVANLTNNRFALGVGIGWAPEEFEWCGVPYARRGARVDEMIDVIKLVLGGGMVEFHGEFSVPLDTELVDTDGLVFERLVGTAVFGAQYFELADCVCQLVTSHHRAGPAVADARGPLECYVGVAADVEGHRL